MAGIVAAKRYKRPTIIVPGDLAIDFIAAGGAELGRPHFSGLRVPCDAVHIAVTQSIDLTPRFRIFHEGVIGRDRAIVTDAKDLADIAGKALRLRTSAGHIVRGRAIAIADTDIKHAVGPED